MDNVGNELGLERGRLLRILSECEGAVIQCNLIRMACRGSDEIQEQLVCIEQ